MQKIFEQFYPQIKINELQNILLNYLNIKELDKVIFFDIETTGLSSRNNICYLIGCVFIENNCFFYEQFFADTPDDEKEIIELFLFKLQNYKYIIHFNGDSFDINFIKKRAYKLNIENPILDNNNVISIDLYKHLRKLQHIFNIPNFKQKTLEKLVNISRDDSLSGKELIEIYRQYIIDYKLNNNYEATLSPILLHNYNDIRMLPEICKLFLYFVNSNIINISSANVIKNNSDLIFDVYSNFSFPSNLSYTCRDIKILYENQHLKLIVPIYNLELKLFFKNYKDYYYIPSEDTAIHKSIAFFVDKNHRKNASAKTCYTKKSSTFIPIIYDEFNTNSHIFKHDYDSDDNYIELNDKLLSNTLFIQNYIVYTIKKIIL